MSPSLASLLTLLSEAMKSLWVPNVLESILHGTIDQKQHQVHDCGSGRGKGRGHSCHFSLWARK